MKTSPVIIKSVLCIAGGALAVLAGGTSAHAASANWIKTGTGLFGDPLNWSTGLVPTAGDTATVSNLGTVQIVSPNSFAFDALFLVNGGLEQTGGDLLTTGDLMLGNLEGTVSVNQTGGTLLAGTRLIFGDGNGASSVISNVTGTIGGTMSANDALVVGRQGGSANLTVTGTLYKVGSTNRLIVGDQNSGVGVVTVAGNGLLKSDSIIHIGNDSGSNGAIIAKDNALVSSTGNFIVGGVDTGTNSNTGVGALTISDQATVNAGGQLFVGSNTGSTGTVTVNGGTLSGNTWMVVGRRGTGTMTVNGGTVQKTGANHLVVGDLGGTGTLKVTNGTVSISGELRLGSGSGSVGTFNMEGGTLTTTNWLAIGRESNGQKGTGTMNISGGTITKNGVGSLTLNGVSSTVNQTGGVLNITYSDTVNVGDTWLSEGTGTQSTWNASGGEANLGKITRIGYRGDATMNVDGSAVVNNGIVYIGSEGTSTGTLNLKGGTFAARYIEEGAGQGFINFDGGTLKATENRVGGNSSSLLPDFEESDLNILAGGMKVDTDGFNAEIVQALAGIGGLEKDGAGELSLLNALTGYEGDTWVNGGALQVTGSIFNDFSSIHLDAGTKLMLNFTGVDVVAGLWLDGVFQAAGTYGAPLSGAMYESDYFAGGGILEVTAVPEPSTFVLLLAGGAGFVSLMMRRKRST